MELDIESLVAATSVQSRPYQLRILHRALELFQTPDVRSILIESPTGSGKTVVGLLLARALHEMLGVRVGWVAMRRNLLTQAERENEARQIRAPCAWISMFDRKPPAGLDLLVVDEAQHDAAGSMAHIHNVVRPRYILGLSATPFRSDRLKLSFDRVIQEAGIHRLIQDGYLSKFDHFTLPDYSVEGVAEAYLREPAHWGKTLVSFHKLSQAYACHKILHKAGVRVTVVTGSTPREAQLAAFRANRFDVLVNCNVLCEGFDCPDLRTVFCRPGCKGITVQTCGRVLRPHPVSPRKRIVQCRNTPWPFTRTAGAALQYVWMDGGWRSLQLNPRIEAVSQRIVTVLSRIHVQLPRFLHSAQPLALLRDRRRQNTARPTVA